MSAAFIQLKYKLPIVIGFIMLSFNYADPFADTTLIKLFAPIGYAKAHTTVSDDDEDT